MEGRAAEAQSFGRPVSDNKRRPAKRGSPDSQTQPERYTDCSATSSLGAKPRRRVFSVTERGSQNRIR